MRLTFADCARGTRRRGVPEGDGLPLVKAGPGGMGACIPRRCVCTRIYHTHVYTHIRTLTHMYTLTNQTLGHACTHIQSHSFTLPAGIYKHTRTHMYTHSRTKHLDITPHTLPHVLHIALPCTPSGKINLENAVTRWKWGVGRLIAECTKTPIVIPVWHVGMEDIQPTRSPYIPQLFKVREANTSIQTYTKYSLSLVLTDTSSIVPLLQYFSKLQTVFHETCTT